LEGWAKRLNHLLLGPALTSDAPGGSAVDLIQHNRAYLESKFSTALETYKNYILVDMRNRPYATVVGELMSLPPQSTQPRLGQTHLRTGSQLIPDRQYFAVSLPNEEAVETARLTINHEGDPGFHGNTEVGCRPQDSDHLVLIECESSFCISDLKDAYHLDWRLTRATDTQSCYVWNQLNDATKRTLVEQSDVSPATLTLMRSLVYALNQLLLTQDLYDEDRFKSIKLRGDTFEKLADQREFGRPLAKLNRLLLEDAYSREIFRSREQEALPGGIELGPLNNPPEAASPWQVYQATVSQEGKQAINQLRFEIEHPGDKGDPNCRQLSIGQIDQQNESRFKPCLTATANCDVVIYGNLTLEGPLVEGPIPADLNDPRFGATILNSWLGGLTVGGTEVDKFYGANALKLEFVIFQTTAFSGQQWSYTIEVTNVGTEELSNIQVFESITITGEASAKNTIVPSLALGPDEIFQPPQVSHDIPSTPTSGEITVIVSAIGFDADGNGIQATISATATIEQPPIG